MRVFSAGLSTETNTYAPWPTGLRGFSEDGPYHGDVTSRGKDTMMGVLASRWRELCHENGFEFVESLFAFAQPSGPTIHRVYEAFRDEILGDFETRGPFDLVLLFLHGAMVSQECEDCEGDILSRMRRLAGPKAVIGAELDLHCHLTPLMVDSATAIVTMKEYPHTDYLERGRELFEVCAGTATGMLRPVSNLFDCRMVGFYPTTIGPMRGLVDYMRAMEQRPKVLSVSFGHGFPWGDTPETGSKVLAVTDGDVELARSVAAQVGREIYAAREALLPRYVTIDEALRIPRGSSGCTILADTADNAGGGAPSDNVSLLRAMLAARLENAVVGCIWDPISVQACREAGLGCKLSLRIGGKCGPMSGDPLDVVAQVRGLRADHDQQGLGPERIPMGDAAWIETGGIDVVLISSRTQVLAPDAFSGLGIDLQTKQVIAVKSSSHFRARFEPLGGRIIPVATPGALQMDFAAIDYRRKRDPDFFPRVHDPLGAAP